MKNFQHTKNWFIFMSTNQLYLLYDICHIFDDFIGRNSAFHLILVLSWSKKHKQKSSSVIDFFQKSEWT